MAKEAKKAAKLEKKLKILTGGYQVRAALLCVCACVCVCVCVVCGCAMCVCVCVDILYGFHMLRLPVHLCTGTVAYVCTYIPICLLLTCFCRGVLAHCPSSLMRFMTRWSSYRSSAAPLSSSEPKSCRPYRNALRWGHVPLTLPSPTHTVRGYVNWSEEHPLSAHVNIMSMHCSIQRLSWCATVICGAVGYVW